MPQDNPYERRRSQLRELTPPGGGGYVRGMVRSGLQGLTFGFADELGGMMGMDAEEIRRRDEAFRSKYGKSAFLAEVAAGLLPMAATAVLPGGQVATAAQAGRFARHLPTLARGAGVLKSGARIAQKHPVATSAAYGALGGAGASEGGAFNRAVGAAGGAAIGTGVGALGHVVSGFSKAAQAKMPQGTRESLSRYTAGLAETPRERAARFLGEAADADELDLAAAVRAQQDAYPQTLMHAGNGNLAFEAERAAVHGRRAYTTLDEALTTRQMDAPEMTASTIQRTTGQGKVNVPEVLDEMKARRMAQARPLYDEAYRVGNVADDEIEGLLRRHPELQEAYEEGRKLARLLDEPEIPPLLDADGNMQLTVNGLDHMEQGLRNMIDRKSRGASGYGRQEAKGLRDQVSRVIQRTRELVPELDAARTQYAGDMAMEDALEAGMDAFRRNMDPDQIAAVMKGMSPDEHEFFRMGAAQRIYRDMAERRVTPQQVPGLLGSTASQERLRVIFGDDAANEIAGLVQNIQRNNMLRQQVVGNSRTGFRNRMSPLGGDELRIPPGATVAQKMVGGFGRVLNLGRESYGKEVANEMANLLVQDPVAALRQIDVNRMVGFNPQIRGPQFLRPTRGAWTPSISGALGRSFGRL